MARLPITSRYNVKGCCGGEGFELACVLEAGDGVVAFERVAQRVDALGGVGAATVVIEAAQCIVGEAAKAAHGKR